MNKLYLRYGNYVDGSPVWATAVEFNPPILRKLYIVDKLSGKDLRNTNFTHTLSKRTKSYEVVFSANDLTNSTKLQCLINCYTSPLVQYNLTNTDWSTNAVTITFDGDGVIPFEFMNNHKLLPRIKVNLIQKYKDT